MPDFNVFYDKRKPNLKLPEFLQEVEKVVGIENLTQKEADIIAYSRDYILLTTRWTVEKTLGARPDAICWPTSEDQIVEIIKRANQYLVPITPMGSASGVVGAALPVYGGLIVDIKRLDKILEINDQNLTVTCQTGINGANIERLLNEKGYTMGQIPQSVRTSTVAGYIAMKAAGQFSGKYGKMEDMILSLRAVLPTGEVIESKNYPRSSTGPQFDRILVGSEGTLGIVTQATMKIWPLPEKRGLVSYAFDRIQDSLEAIRLIHRHQINPAVIRIYDHIETSRHFGDVKEAKKRVMVVFVCEGPTDLVDLEVKVTNEMCQKNHGIACGENPVQHWFETRFNVKESSKYTPLDVIFDTIEMAAMWDHAYDIYESVIAEMRKVPGLMVASGHASHFYPQGVCWYFTFGGVPETEGKFPEFHQAVWDAAMQGCLKVQGTISHHHGIGILRSKWMEKEWTGPDMELARRIKRVVDPNNIMNPGKLYGADYNYEPAKKPE